MSDDADATRLAAQAREAGDAPTAWFERLYAEARSGRAVVPWDRDAPSDSMIGWFVGQAGAGRTAMVVGCGLGRDSEFVGSLGFDTTAFDVSPTAIELARARHPDSAVQYEVGDLLALPASWRGAFELVVESHNVQALPPDLHAEAAAAVASLVAPGGTLLVLGAVGAGDAAGPPWPLTRAEIDGFAVEGITLVSVEALGSNPARWRAEVVREKRNGESPARTT